MIRLNIILTAALALTLVACQVSTPEPMTPLERPASEATFSAAEGWSMPHPGVYIQEVYAADGTLKREGYVTTTSDGLQWLAARRQQQLDAVRRGEPLHLSGDVEVRRAQKLHTLNMVISAAQRAGQP